MAAYPIVTFHNTPACRNISMGEAMVERIVFSATRMTTFF
jgi:hypothetical protein